MAQDQQEYKKLPGIGKSFFMGISTLWLGKDHLLFIDSRRLAEDYKRFYFVDIQALIVRKTAPGKIQNLILGFLCIACFLLSASLSEGEAIVLGLCGGFFFLVLTINWFRGPTCECHIRTGVQIEKLPSLNRIKKAWKAIDLLKPHIEAVQGKITSRQIQEFAQAERGAGRSWTASNRKNGVRRHENGRFHEALFLALIVNGLLVAADIFHGSVGVSLMSMAVSLALGALVAIALVKQHRSDLKSSITTTVWMALAYVCIDFVAGYVLFVYTAFHNPMAVQNQWEMVKFVSTLSPFDSPWVMGFDVFTIVSCFAFGISGLVFMRNPHVRRSASPVVNANLSRGQQTLQTQE